jgi:hypothetical protein
MPKCTICSSYCKLYYPIDLQYCAICANEFIKIARKKDPVLVKLIDNIMIEGKEDA